MVEDGKKEENVDMNEVFQDICESNLPERSFIAYNKIALTSSTFHIELISPEEDMEKLQERVCLFLLLCSDDSYREMYLSSSKIVLENMLKDIKQQKEVE